jgi:hypothetical protein
VARDRLLTVKVSEPEHEGLRGLARGIGITMSEWVRRRIREATGEEGGEGEVSRPEVRGREGGVGGDGSGVTGPSEVRPMPDVPGVGGDGGEGLTLADLRIKRGG